MFKKAKKQDQISIEEEKGQLFLGEEGKLRLLTLRPLELIEFSEFAGSNSDDLFYGLGKQS